MTCSAAPPTICRAGESARGVPPRLRFGFAVASSLILLLILRGVLAGESANGTREGRVFAVGPRQPLKSLSAVPWSGLGPGDVVRIHWRPEPYREKILIHTRGTVDRPIRIVGVRGPRGERPVIDGSDAATIAGQAQAYGSYEPMQALALILIYDHDYHRKPAHIVIEGLHLRNARREFSFVDCNGRRTRYADGAAGIRIQAADDVRIIDNEIENCGNGIFTMCQGYNESSLTRDLLIEGNSIHHNGQRDSYLEHGVYLQAIGVTCQFNRFGPNAVGAQGVSLKDRSAATVIRYNWFDSGAMRVLDLVEVEDCAPWFLESAYRHYLEAGNLEEGPGPYRLREVRAVEARYRKTHVYGNLIRHIGSRTPGSNLIHYGYDNDPAYARGGTLYFYHNTLVLLNDRRDSWRLRLFDVYPQDEAAGTPAKEKVYALNNIIYVASETPGAEPSYFCWGRQSGTIVLGVNAVGGEWRTRAALLECYSGPMKPEVRGQKNIISLSRPPVDFRTLAPRPVAAIANRAEPLPAEIARSHPVLYQYQRHQKRASRPRATDLGALSLPSKQHR
ncbi:MAG: hypothetical protein GXP27_06545 [Planctomycetes bacterium]|nr:hypothetical protein [Planctomycetota bacterium]